MKVYPRKEWPALLSVRREWAAREEAQWMLTSIGTKKYTAERYATESPIITSKASAKAKNVKSIREKKTGPPKDHRIPQKSERNGMMQPQMKRINY